MNCEKCHFKFCWSCLSIRHEEMAQGSRAHYCILHHTFQSNRVWANNPNVTTYTVLDRRSTTEPVDVAPVRRALFQDGQVNQPAGPNRWVEDSDSDDDEWRQPPANDWGPAQNQEVDGAW